MNVKIILLLTGLILASCGSEDSAGNVQNDDVLDQDEFDIDFEDYTEDDPELGEMTVELAEDNYNDAAYCSLIITRVREQGFANIILVMGLAGDLQQISDQDYDVDNFTSGEINLSGVQNNAKVFTLSSLVYEPPHIIVDGQTQAWVFDFYNPRGSFDLSVNGEPFDAFSSNERDRSNLPGEPNLWEVSMEFEAGLLRPQNDDEEIRSPGNFQYEGLCTVNVSYIEL